MHWNKGRRSSWYVQWIQMSLSYLLAPSMTCLRLNLWSTSGLLLVWARITGFTTSTPSVQASGSHDQKAYLCSMHTLAVTRPLHSMEKARSQYGKPGSLMKMLQRHLYFWPTIPSSSSNWMMNHSRSSRDWLLLYDKTSPLTSVNEARKELFCKKNLAMDKLPPTQDALLQHLRRAVYQAGIWTTSTQTQQVFPSPQQYAWNKVSNLWVPVWMTTPEVSRACRELIKCSCKGDCSNCSCGEANLDCSPLCKCKCVLDFWEC